MDNNGNNNNNNETKTDFAAITGASVKQPRAKYQDNVQVALGELKDQVQKRNTRAYGRKPDRQEGPAVRNDNPVRSDRRDQRDQRDQRDTRGPDNRGRSQGPRDQRDQRRSKVAFGRDVFVPHQIAQGSSPNASTSNWLSTRVPVLHPDKNLAYTGTLRIISIGGVGNVNKNMYIYEYGEDIVILDCGIGFADEDMPGVDFLIPDITYLQDKKHKVRGILHTHGHEDHIGALPYIWPELKCPIYASKLTCGFIKTKLVEHELPIDQIVEIDPDVALTLGSFHFQFFKLSHSIPDTIGFVIDTPVGRVIHSADFKFDWTPVIGAPTDVQRIAQFGADGVLLLLSDSLGAEKPGYTLSEQVILSQFDAVAQKTLGKMMITTTSSNISRIQMALDIAAKYGKKVAVSGRSMDQNIGVARNMGYLKFSDENFVPLEEIGRYQDNELLLIVAGSQGQYEAALSRVANDEHRHIKLRPGDSVVFSTDAIPGNENQTNRLIDHLISRGAEVYYSNIFNNIHVSGHAAQEELKLMLALVKAKYLLPIGGTERSTKKYGDLAQSMGYRKEQVLITHNGDIVEFSAQKDQIVTPRTVGKIETKDVMVDGLGIGDLSEAVMHDRQVMAEEGMLVVIVRVNHETGAAQSGVQIVSRGFVYMKESSEFINDIARLVDDILDEEKNSSQDWNVLKRKIEDRVSKYIYKEIKRNPLILPVMYEV